MVDRLVESELDRRRAQAMSEVDRADADVDAFAKYARSAAFDYTCRPTESQSELESGSELGSRSGSGTETGSKTTDNNKNTDSNSKSKSSGNTCTTPHPRVPQFDSAVLDDLEEEARSRVEAMVDQVDPYYYLLVHPSTRLPPPPSPPPSPRLLTTPLPTS